MIIVILGDYIGCYGVDDMIMGITISPILQKITLGLKPFPLKSARKAIRPLLLKVTKKLSALSFKIYS